MNTTRRQIIASAGVALAAFGQIAPAFAQRSHGSVSAESRGSSSWQSPNGNASGSRTVTQTSDGYNVNKQVQTQGGYSKTVDKDVNTQDPSVNRTSTATNPWGESATRSRDVEGQGGYATVSGSASTSTGREAEGQGYAGRNAYGQPVVGGTVNTKYNGSYAGAAARNPYGGWTSATVGPYGGKVTTTLPSGYRTSTYYGRPYYSYGGAYYRPYSYHGVPYYYPVPPPYYAYYQSPPVGAIVLVVAGATYLVSQGNYAKQTTSSSGQVVYQSVPAPEGAQLTTLPAQRVLVTVSGALYYLSANTFYRRVVDGAQERFVVITAPAGVVFVSALPADFEVVQLNTMYFKEQGRYFVPFLAADGKELYVQVDTPPQPATPAAAAPAAPVPASAPVPATAPPAPAVRTVSESIAVPAGTLLVARLATDVSSATAATGNRFQAFLDQDLSANGRLIVTRGARLYGVVTAADRGSKGKAQPVLSVALTDINVGGRVLTIQTTRVTAAVTAGSPAAAVVPAQTPQAFTLAAPLQIDIMTNVAIR